MNSPHPSFLELDRHALGLPAPKTEAHLARCERCRRHLREVARVADERPLPAWLETRGPPRRTERLRARGVLIGAVAIAAALALAVLRDAPPKTPYDGRKGAPSAWLHVLREGVARPWDGAPLSTGDRIRLELAPQDFRHVSVFSLPAGAAPQLLYRGSVPAHARVALPKAWEIDAAPGPERIAIVFARVELSRAAAELTLRERDPAEVWVVELVLPKRGKP